jgi:hypothetical protein
MDDRELWRAGSFVCAIRTVPDLGFPAIVCVMKEPRTADQLALPRPAFFRCLFCYYVHPFSDIAVFHCSCVLRISSDERHS